EDGWSGAVDVRSDVARLRADEHSREDVATHVIGAHRVIETAHTVDVARIEFARVVGGEESAEEREECEDAEDDERGAEEPVLLRRSHRCLRGLPSGQLRHTHDELLPATLVGSMAALMRSAAALRTTKIVTRSRETIWTTGRSSLAAASVSSEPSPLSPNACSAIAEIANRLAMTEPEIARICGEALRKTWTVRIRVNGIPRTRAVSTCSEFSCWTIDDRVTRLT